ncbi:hypothetical protein [Nocardioides sp. CFH 31398]|uniref:hypothetical protein n=1 Tax=Nocardioides sp. CFH 31398 TaxID=2919579 RepID=UPI001F05656A|nr:hypothetical protein [Nocardioides sp. CFH 31398]MCH1866099.1 hypothetical protein [Nocardioides sp. CFH 31398]
MSPLPRFTEVARRRPVALVQPGTSIGPGGPVAPYVAAQGPSPALRSATVTLRAALVGRRVGLEVVRDGRTRRLLSARHGWVRDVDELAVTVTGPVATAWSRSGGAWTARARTALGLGGWWRGLRPDDGVTASGTFGQLGLRDLRLVTHADGTPYEAGRAVLLTATSAGPGGFRTGHTSVWALDRDSLDLAHRADLFFRRDDVVPAGQGGGVHGDHAGHLVRDGGAWLVATSTWGTFDEVRRPRVGVRLGTSFADLTRGQHVLDTRPLALPVDGLGSVGTWDPQLVHDGRRWLVAFVSARRFFSFHPALAAGEDLDDLTLLGAATDRSSCEGPVLVQLDDGWRLLASDSRDEVPARRAGYPCFDLAMAEVGRLDATYPTNVPWPMVVPDGDGWLMVGFDGTPYGGGLAGYGTHGEVVLQRGPEPV